MWWAGFGTQQTCPCFALRLQLCCLCVREDSRAVTAQPQGWLTATLCPVHSAYGMGHSTGWLCSVLSLACACRSGWCSSLAPPCLCKKPSSGWMPTRHRSSSKVAVVVGGWTCCVLTRSLKTPTTHTSRHSTPTRCSRSECQLVLWRRWLLSDECGAAWLGGCTTCVECLHLS